jgi:signal peptidase I
MDDAPFTGNQNIKISSRKAIRLASRLWAGFLSLLYPGLGQAFRGSYGRGVWFAIGSVVALLAFTQSIYAWSMLPSGILFTAVWALSGLCVRGVACWAGIDAFRLGRNNTKRVPRWWLRSLIYAGFILALESREFVIAFPRWEPFSIPSTLMEPTTLVGDYILTIKGYYKNHRPHRGELTVFALPRDISVDFFKRVIGVPGDDIQMKSGVLFVNGTPVSREAAGPYVFTGNLQPETLHEYRETLLRGGGKFGSGRSPFVGIESARG